MFDKKNVAEILINKAEATLYQNLLPLYAPEVIKFAEVKHLYTHMAENNYFDDGND
jgi:hypothetical protein